MTLPELQSELARLVYTHPLADTNVESVANVGTCVEITADTADLRAERDEIAAERDEIAAERDELAKELAQAEKDADTAEAEGNNILDSV